MRIITNPLVPTKPKLELSPGFKACSPEFRCEFNEWLLQRFGVEETIYKITNPFTKEPTLICHPSVEHTLEHALGEINRDPTHR